MESIAPNVTGTLTEALIIFLLIMVNGILAMSEIALVSSRKTKLQQWADNGDAGAKAALKIAGAPNDFLSTIQIGITLIGICAGAYGGANIADDLAVGLKLIPALAPHAQGLSITIVVVIITYFSLIVGELVPKRLALQAPELVAKFVAKPMVILSGIARPLVHLLSGSTNLILKAAGIKEYSETPVSQAEIHVMIEQAAEAGIVQEAEQEMVAEVLKLGDRKVTSLMTPRIEVYWLNGNDNLEHVISLISESSYSRFLVCDETVDEVLGVVEGKTIMLAALESKEKAIRDLVIQPLYVPENTTALQLLERFRDAKQQIAIVLDEYGGMQGLVTSDDIFQAIVGDLPNVGEAPKWSKVALEDGSWLIDGHAPIEEFFSEFSLKRDLDDGGTYQTLAGFILCQLEKIPAIGEQFNWHNLTFEIVDLDRQRIDKVKVSEIKDE
ncbi:MAG: hemolysin family protein [Candidatus Obscuribacterales bacterium]